SMGQRRPGDARERGGDDRAREGARPRREVDGRGGSSEVVLRSDPGARRRNEEIHPGVRRPLQQYVGFAEADCRLDVPWPRARRSKKGSQPRELDQGDQLARRRSERWRVTYEKLE